MRPLVGMRKGKSNSNMRYLELEDVSRNQYLITVKIGSTVLRNALNLTSLATLWCEICPNKEWLSDGIIKSAISAASDISVATLKRHINNNPVFTSNWSYLSTKNASTVDIFDENLARAIFHLKPGSHGSTVATIHDTSSIHVQGSGKHAVGRPRRPDLADLDEEWSDLLRENLLPWVAEFAPVTSGTRGARRFRYPTWKLGFSAYRQWANEKNKSGISYSKFREFLGQACIGPSDYSYFVCPYCLLKDDDPIKVIHKGQCEYQFNAYQTQKSQIGKGTLFLVVDWARIHECRGKNVELLQVVKGKLIWKKLMMTFSDLGFALCVKPDDGPLDTHFINCFSLLPQKANFFKAGVALVADYVRKKGWNIERIWSWSDNGLRNYNCLFTYRDFFQHFPDLKVIQVCHFPPHHGHGLVDANFGGVKRYLREQFYAKGPIEPMDAFRSLQNRLNTNAYLIPAETKPFPIQVKNTTPGITSFNTFKMEIENGNVTCKAKGKPDDEMMWCILELRQSRLLYDKDTPIPERSLTANEDNDDENIDDSENPVLVPLPSSADLDTSQNIVFRDDTLAEYLPTGQSREDVVKLLKSATKNTNDFYRILSSFGRNEELIRYLESLPISPANIKIIEDIRSKFRGLPISPDYYRSRLPSDILGPVLLAVEKHQ